MPEPAEQETEIVEGTKRDGIELLRRLSEQL
jgi:hypothetical protein